MNAIVKGNAPGHYRSTLGTLLEGLELSAPETVVTELSQDSRTVTRGGAFLACRGRTGHGLDHLAVALERGAAVVLWEPAEGIAAPVVPASVVTVAVPNLGQRVGDIADRFFRRPSEDLRVAGITGTNGKTTCAYLLAQASDLVGRRSAYLGTLGFGRAGSLSGLGLTTPDAVSVHRRIAQARDAGAATLAMEVSSHALDQARVGAVRFDTAVFTNLTRDHLDYHGTLESYGAAKTKLFHAPELRCAVINVRDPFGRELAPRLSPDVEKVLFSTANEIWAERNDGWIRVSEMRAGPAGLTLQVESRWGAGTLRSRLVGEFNAENLLAVLGVLLGWNVPLQTALVALAACDAPPGRMESFGGDTLPLAIVDYAHTPDALGKVLEAARAHTRGRLFCVFGCGGDRDPGKRPQMGAIAESLADVVIVTDDNPRTEDSAAILEQIVAGMAYRETVQVIADRAEAIQHALAEADPGDVVVIAGKGHEDYQIVGRDVRPFSDRDTVRRALGEIA